jgi:hypothetical protein
LDQAAKMEAAANGVLAANQTVATSMTALVAPVATATTKAQMYANELALLRTHAIEPLTAAQKAQVDELLSYGKSHEWIASRIEGVTVPAIKLYVKAQQDAADETKLSAADMKKAWEDLTHFREAADKRQIEIGKELATAEQTRAGVVNEQVVAELNARIKLNDAYGLDAQGHAKMTSALDTYNTKLAELHKNKQEGINQYAQEDLLMQEYTQALYDEAVAHDKAAEAERKAKEEKEKHTKETEKATKATGVYMNQLHMLVDDPKLAAFFGGNVVANSLYSAGSGGFTPEEAAAMAAGQFINFAASAMATGWKGFGTRAAGGPVSAGSPYLVGERGPELFVPSRSGTIAPNGGGDTIHIHISQPLGTPDAIARAVGDAMTTRSRAIGARL